MPRNQQYEMKDMSGALFKNEDKDPENEQHDNWADYRGQIMVSGIKYWLKSWIKKGQQSGKTYMSLAVEEMDNQGEPPPRRRQSNGRPAPRQQSSPRQQQRSRPQRDPDLDTEPDDIPF